MSIHHPKLVQSSKRFKDNQSIKYKVDNSEKRISKKSIDRQDKKNTSEIKYDYKNGNYYYNDEDYSKEYPYQRLEYLNANDKKYKYNIDSNSSHLTIENEDGIIKYIPEKINYNYTNFNTISNQKVNNFYEIGSHKNTEYFDDNNSEDSINNIFYENDNEECQNKIRKNKSARKKYYFNQFQENIHFYLEPSTKQTKKNSLNIINKVHDINLSSDKNLKIRVNKKKLHKCGNNTTTNNTFNNNIYYINPINVKNNSSKKKDKVSLINITKNKRNNNNRKSLTHKTIEIQKIKYEMDYFKMNNIDKSKADIYIKAAILIQSALRGYLVKIKLYNNINLYVCCKRGIDILQDLLLNCINGFWKKLKKKQSKDSLKATPFSIRAKYKLKASKIKDSILNFHKETSDSFNIINRNTKRELKEKKLKSILKDVIRENNELKNRLIDNRNIEIRIKSLINENKKNQNINAIIMKDNMNLAKKLKDFQDYRNHRLFIENQYSIGLNQMEQMQMQELNKNNEIILKRLQIIILRKLMYKKNIRDYILMNNYFKIYRNIVQKMKNKDKEENMKKEIHMKNLVNIIDKKINVLKVKNFWKIYYNGLALEREDEIIENKKKEKLKKLIDIQEKRNKIILSKMFFKYVLINTKCRNEEKKNKIVKEEEQERENLKEKIMKKLLLKQEKNIKLIFGVVLEKWNLKSKIIGMKNAAKDKKKKRRQKKKNLRLLYKNGYGLGGSNSINHQYCNNFCKNIHEFSYNISNGQFNKESNLNESGRNLQTNKSSSNIKNKNKEKNKGIKKIMKKSINKRRSYNDQNKNFNNEKENVNNNEESDEDSGDSFDLDNNSDC